MSEKSFTENDDYITGEEDCIRSGSKWSDHCDFSDEEPPLKAAKKDYGSGPHCQETTPEDEDGMISSKNSQNHASECLDGSERNEEAHEDAGVKRKHMGHHIKLPPEPKGQCDPVIQERIADLHDKMLRSGKSLLHSIQTTKKFRNPVIYEKLVEFLGIDERGTNYPPEFYNPRIWGPESYYDKLNQAQQCLNMPERIKEDKKETMTSQPTRKSKWN